MDTKQWVGVAFVVVLIAFAVYAFTRRGQLEPHRWQILRFLLSLCGAFAGGLIAGDALFRVVQKWGLNNELFASGTSGFALFLAVWFTFPGVAGKPNIGFAFSLPNGWTFQGAATAIAKNDHALVDLNSFTVNELSVILSPAALRTDTPLQALLALHNLAPKGSIRSYTVTYDSPTYRFIV